MTRQVLQLTPPNIKKRRDEEEKVVEEEEGVSYDISVCSLDWPGCPERFRLARAALKGAKSSLSTKAAFKFALSTRPVLITMGLVKHRRKA